MQSDFSPTPFVIFAGILWLPLIILILVYIMALVKGWHNSRRYWYFSLFYNLVLLAIIAFFFNYDSSVLERPYDVDCFINGSSVSLGVILSLMGLI
jgi:hypothetical protein